jgi:hypothetical protein
MGNLSMGLILGFSCTTPGQDSAHYCLPALVDVDMLDLDGL